MAARQPPRSSPAPATRTPPRRPEPPARPRAESPRRSPVPVAAPPRAPNRPAPAARPPAKATTAAAGAKQEHPILFQKFFKSVGPRTYAAQVKQANNGNHYLILTEGKRDDATGEVRKTKLICFSEDFGTFFRLLHDTAQWIKANPVPDAVKQKRAKFWAKRRDDGRT
ncbi:MAG TPA: DUF3276 family protein [Tepidisphaeraceae bacterium]|nr:DUF3276 family protein [Tepidisphaeraceae bacterium]